MSDAAFQDAVYRAVVRMEKDPEAFKAEVERKIAAENAALKARRAAVQKAAQTIRLQVTENPKKVGSKAHQRFAQYRDGMTIDEALAAGITKADLKNDSEKGFISIG